MLRVLRGWLFVPDRPPSDGGQADLTWRPPAAWTRVPLSSEVGEPGPTEPILPDWPPGFLVLAWPQLFAGVETTEQKQVEVAVLALAEAGMVDLFLAHRWGSSRPSLRIVPRQGSTIQSTQLNSATPWVWQKVLTETHASRPGRYGSRLHHLRPQTARAAAAHEFMTPGRRDRFLPRPPVIDPALVSDTEPVATLLAQRWDSLVRTQPTAHETLRRATSIPEAVPA